MSLPTSYPEPRYHGEGGEAGVAAYRPASAEPELRPGGGAFHYLSTGAGTGGEFGLYRTDLPPGGGTSTHFHRTISEAFFMLSGELRLFDGARWIGATSGDYLYVPPGGLHAFYNTADQPASFLMLFTPGAPREGYFEGLRDLPHMSEEERLEFMLRHDNHMVEPGGGPSGPLVDG